MSSHEEHGSSGLSKQPWLILTEEFEPEETDIELAEIFKDLLLSDRQATPKLTAARVDEYYKDQFLPANKFEKDEGLTGFLYVFYEALISIARVIGYDDDRQDVLVRVIVELHNLPPRKAIIYGVERLAYAEENILGGVIEEHWNGDFPSSSSPAFEYRPDYLSSGEWHTDCERWLNFSTFCARCVRAGIVNFSWRKHAWRELENGLEETHYDKKERDCKVMLAAQYVLIAGEALYRTFVTENLVGDEAAKGRAREKWVLWQSRFAAITEGEEEGKLDGKLDSKVKAAVSQAKEKMVELSAGEGGEGS